jgi:hypothetical protein
MLADLGSWDVGLHHEGLWEVGVGGGSIDHEGCDMYDWVVIYIVHRNIGIEVSISR